MIEFKGECKGVRLQKRGINDDHIIVVILTEDDGEWFDSDSFSSHWINEMIEKLQEAKKYIETQEPHIHNGKQCGYKFSNAKVNIIQEMDIIKHMEHLPTCGIMQDWSEAETAMADTPEKFRDNDWQEARKQLNHKINTCTCGLSDSIELVFKLANEYKKKK